MANLNFTSAGRLQAPGQRDIKDDQHVHPSGGSGHGLRFVKVAGGMQRGRRVSRLILTVERIQIDFDAEWLFLRQAVRVEGFWKKEDVRILAGVDKRSHCPPPASCGSATPRWFLYGAVASQRQIRGGWSWLMAVECHARRNQAKTKKTGKCMVLWDSSVRSVELDYVGILSTAKPYVFLFYGLWFMVYGFKITEYERLLSHVRTWYILFSMFWERPDPCLASDFGPLLPA